MPAESRPEVEVIDALDLAPARFKRFYQGSFEATVKHAPWFYGAIFRGSSEAARFRAFRAVRRTFNRIVAHELCDHVASRRPDAVVTTHFLSLDALARRKRRGRLDAPLACVVTDYVAHGFWVEPDADRYYVPTAEVGLGLKARGIRLGKVRVTGIPVDRAFAAQPPSRDAANAPAGRKVVLVLSGGFGMGPVPEIVASLGARADPPVALEVVCGRNAELRARVEALRPGVKAPMNVHGFVTTIPAMMAAADVVVTKPGGLTTSEAIATGRPMLLFEAMPGQEEGNARYFVKAGAALEIEPATAGETLARLLSEPGRLEGLAARAREISRPDAAAQIAADALTLERRARRPYKARAVTR